MKFAFLGTGAGTEPIAGFRHSSFTVEREGRTYWFDAGENSAYAAHTGGVDVLATRAIFLTHWHIDHTGGLPLLVNTIRKLDQVSNQPTSLLEGRMIPIVMADQDVWDATNLFLRKYTRAPLLEHFERVVPHDGVVFDQEGFSVTAHHNLHLGEPEPGQPWQSFSYRMEADGRAVVYSGDIKAPSDVAPLLKGVDMVLMETAHIAMEDVCRYVRDNTGPETRLGLLHHGRPIMADLDGQMEIARGILGERVFFTRDGMEMQV